MPRQIFGEPDGIPEGSNFTLEAKLTINGVVDSARVTSSATITVTFSDSVLNGGTALLTDEGSDSFNPATGLVKFDVGNSQSSAWEAGLYNGDIKAVDSGSSVTYWPVGIRIREAKD